MQHKVEFLPLFYNNFNTPWEQVLHLGISKTFPAKTIITRPARTAYQEGMYYIKRGLIRLSQLTATGEEHDMLYMGHGMLFNEIPMFRADSNHLFTCLKETDTVFLPKSLLTKQFVQQHPELMLNLLESLVNKASCFYTKLYTVNNLDTFTSVCRTLYSMHLYNQHQDKITVPGLTQQELASFLSIHRSSLHKVLIRLKNEGIIGNYSKKELNILRPEVLYTYTLGEKE